MQTVDHLEAVDLYRSSCFIQVARKKFQTIRSQSRRQIECGAAEFLTKSFSRRESIFGRAGRLACSLFNHLRARARAENERNLLVGALRRKWPTETKDGATTLRPALAPVTGVNLATTSQSSERAPARIGAQPPGGPEAARSVGPIPPHRLHGLQGIARETVR